MNTVAILSDDSLSVEKSDIFISELDPLLSKFLVPMHLFLEEDVVVFALKVTLKKDMMEGVNSLNINLDPFQSIFDVFFPLEDVSKDLMVERDRI
ncbi:hypothetical protein A2U01_0015529 [Trifolium medium]|uniref:Uncharacterized protein n=1 Tax=Trifolium medium TaxID=97028 RepID=A0A392N420_9FABA|nr:hypothetical protein [Trifolium medium]